MFVKCEGTNLTLIIHLIALNRCWLSRFRLKTVTSRSCQHLALQFEYFEETNML